MRIALLRLPFILLCLLGFSLTAKAFGDAIAIDEVQVNSTRHYAVSNNGNFSTHSSIESQPQTLETLSTTSLNDYLLQQTPVYIRQSGAGQTATVSTRGTSASHTSVLWNGMPVNSLTMGQANLNLLPVFFFDNVSAQLGGESSLYGSGAIGGNINLSSKTSREQGFNVLLQQSIASYSHYTTGAKVGYASKKLSSKTSLLYTQTKNNFEFKNTAKYGAPTETQRNAGYRTWGAMQNMQYSIASSHELSLNAWYTDSYRQIQPTMPSNLRATMYDSIADKSLRTNLSYNGSYGRTSALATIGYCYDREDFRNDIIATHNLLGVAEVEHRFGSYLQLKGGIAPQRITPTGNSYASSVVEWRTDVYAMGSAKVINDRLLLNLSARQSFITNLTPPLTYAAGANFAIVKRKEHLLKVNAGTSTSYRAPSINERYWGQSINSHLLPEKGNNVEGGAQYKFANESSEALITANVYHNMVSNWIRWMPYGSIWKPVNLQKVRAQGLDVVANGSYRINNLKFNLNLNYAYSLVTVVDGGANLPTLNGYQMAYSPKYRGSGTLGVTYKNTNISTNVAYVGLTHSSDIYDIIPAYTLVNLSASQTANFGIHKLELLVSINNLLNKAYQSIKYFAMPGINFECTLRYHIQTSKSNKNDK